MRGRLQQDDFIEDDDGGGYADNGMDPCDEDRHYTDEEDSDDARRSGSSNSISLQALRPSLLTGFALKRRTRHLPRDLGWLGLSLR